MAAAQHVSVPVDHITMEVVKHNAHNRENKSTNLIALVTAVKVVNVYAQIILQTNSNNAKKNVQLGIKSLIQEV